MGLGWNAATLACHLLMVISAGLVAERCATVSRVPNIGTRLWTSTYFQWSAWALMTAFVIERGYYVLARASVSQGVDFWQSHPAPEVLAIMLTLAIWHFGLALLKVADLLWGSVLVRVSIEAVALVVLGVVVTAGAW